MRKHLYKTNYYKFLQLISISDNWPVITQLHRYIFVSGIIYLNNKHYKHYII